MKKTLLVGLLVCAILASVVTGTLAVYSASIDEMTGDVVAKSFVIDGSGSADFTTGLTIAPTETLNFVFDVSNFKNGVVTETKMSVDATFDFAAMAGKASIAPLTVSITRTGGGLVSKTVTGVAGEKIRFVDDVAEANVQTTFRYTVTIEWESGQNDINFQGANFGNEMVFSATGTQVA